MIKKRIEKMKLLVLCVFATSLPIGLNSCGAAAESLGGVGTRSAVGTIGYDSKEKQILGQARGVGAIGGAVVGGLLAKKMGMKTHEGAIIGGLLGGLAGDAVGKRQASTAKSKRLSNQNLRSMIASTRANNRRLAAYNARVDKRIAQLKAKSRADRKRLAKAERISVDRAIKETDGIIRSREVTAAKLVGSDRATLAREIRIAKNHRATLAKQRTTLVGYESLTAN